MIGIVPAAGAGQRIQPLGCSKELLPVGTRIVDGRPRPKAVAEYLVERMIAAGAEQICIVISAEKSDIVRYFAESEIAAQIFYVVQPRPQGLCDALFRASPFAAHNDRVVIGLPDTIWFPHDGLRTVSESLVEDSSAGVNLLLFPVPDPAHFDAVVCDQSGLVETVEVKQPQPSSEWIWGALATTGASFSELHRLWESRARQDEYLGHLLNAYIAGGGRVRGSKCGELYMDVGTLDGYHQAQQFLRRSEQHLGTAA